MQTVPSINSSATSAPKATSYTPRVRLTAHRGWYRVQSGTNPSVWYDTSANTCTCPARKPCKHQRFVRALNVAFFVRKEVALPATVPTVQCDDLVRVPVYAQPVRVIEASDPDVIVVQDGDGTFTACVARASVTEIVTPAASGLTRPVRRDEGQGTTPTTVVTHLDELGIAAEARLASARRALQETDQRDDSYAVLWRQVDGLEREVAALHYQAMRAA